MTNEMTNEEARAIITALKQSYINLKIKSDLKKKTVKENIKAYEMAIKALETIPKYKDAYNKGWDDGAKATYEHLKMCEEEQEPCEDVISRQAVLDEAFEVDTKEYGRIDVVGVDAIDALPSVNPQESKTDSWSIKDVADTFKKHGLIREQEPSITWVTGADGAKIAFKDVPAWKVIKICQILDDVVEVEDQEPTGHWEWLTEDKYRCSNCNSETRVDECLNEPMYEFCPFCGARMESEE